MPEKWKLSVKQNTCATISFTPTVDTHLVEGKEAIDYFSPGLPVDECIALPSFEIVDCDATPCRKIDRWLEIPPYSAE